MVDFPLDRGACARADDAFYADPANSDLIREDGTRIPLERDDPRCSEWIRLYEAELARNQPSEEDDDSDDSDDSGGSDDSDDSADDSDDPSDPGEVVAPCPQEANLAVSVYDSSGDPVEGVEVSVDGVGASYTNADGIADFGTVQPGSYDILAIRACHRPDRIETTEAVNPQETRLVRLEMEPFPITIAATQAEYTVVLDDTGAAVTAHPVLAFNISGGPPNHLFDVQVAVDSAAGLNSSPGLSNSWQPGQSRADRVSKSVFSSWSSGQNTLRLDGSGAATFEMPLEWWRDQARRTLASFNEKDVYFRVIALQDDGTPCCHSAPNGGAGAGSAKIKNNLVRFRVVDLGYVFRDGYTGRSIRMEFTVREAGTTEMYTMVQWMEGYGRLWSGTPLVAQWPRHRLYGILHDYNFPDFTIDRLETNPRYWDGNWNISADRRTASATDRPGVRLRTNTIGYCSIDFETRCHLNFEVPASVTITRQDGSPPVYGVITGELADPQPIILSSDTWQTRVLDERTSVGVSTTHPATYAGPGPGP